MVEARMLFLLKKGRVSVPFIYQLDEQGILMEYIRGPSLLEYLVWQEKMQFYVGWDTIEPAVYANGMLCRWLKTFYDTVYDLTGKKIILGEINFRNFILRDSIYGIDFEDCREGEKEEDVGRICAFALTNNPPFTPWKYSFVDYILNIFVEGLSLDRELVNKYFLRELASIHKARGTKQWSR
ncbi:MAG: hypothetical protein ACOYBM_08365 [Dethiobacteria bacterium]|jgi:hypothetical protein